MMAQHDNLCQVCHCSLGLCIDCLSLIFTFLWHRTFVKHDKWWFEITVSVLTCRANRCWSQEIWGRGRYYWYYQNSTWLSGHVLCLLITTTHDLTFCWKSIRILDLIGAKIFSRSPSRVYNCPDTPGSTCQQSLFYKGMGSKKMDFFYDFFH